MKMSGSSDDDDGIEIVYERYRFVYRCKYCVSRVFLTAYEFQRHHDDMHSQSSQAAQESFAAPMSPSDSSNDGEENSSSSVIPSRTPTLSSPPIALVPPVNSDEPLPKTNKTSFDNHPDQKGGSPVPSGDAPDKNEDFPALNGDVPVLAKAEWVGSRKFKNLSKSKESSEKKGDTDQPLNSQIAQESFSVGQDQEEWPTLDSSRNLGSNLQNAESDIDESTFHEVEVEIDELRQRKKLTLSGSDEEENASASPSFHSERLKIKARKKSEPKRRKENKRKTPAVVKDAEHDSVVATASAVNEDAERNASSSDLQDTSAANISTPLTPPVSPEHVADGVTSLPPRPVATKNSTASSSDASTASTPTKMFFCLFCQKPFTRERTLQGHMTGMHRKELEQQVLDRISPVQNEEYHEKLRTKKRGKKRSSAQAKMDDDMKGSKKAVPEGAANSGGFRTKKKDLGTVTNDNRSGPALRRKYGTGMNRRGSANRGGDFNCIWCPVKFNLLEELQNHAINAHIKFICK